MCKTKYPVILIYFNWTANGCVMDNSKCIQHVTHDVKSMFIFLFFFCLPHRNGLHARPLFCRTLWQILICEIIHTTCIYTNSIAMDHLCTYIWISWRNNTLENESNSIRNQNKCVRNKFMLFLLKANIFQFLFCFTLKFRKLITIANGK